MSPDRLRRLLGRVAAGELEVESALGALVKLPFEDIGYARVDHHRRLRTGFPEAVWGSEKSAEQIAGIIERYLVSEELCLVTRVDEAKARAVRALLRDDEGVAYESVPRLLIAGLPLSPRGRGAIAVVAAGTSDLPVAEEAARTAELFGMTVHRVTDVGVAALQRVLSVREELDSCEVVIVVAGMEGALPAVIKGLVSRPVIGVPTNVGVGAALGGLTPMLGMLTACAPGMTVVNVDNGFGAGYAAAVMNLDRPRSELPARGGR